MNTNDMKWKSVWSLLLACGMLLAACGDSADNTSADSVVDDAVDNEASTPPEVAGGNTDYLASYTLDDEEFGTQVTVTVDGATRSIATNALPDHETGEFPNAGNPNTISAQALSYEYPVEPVFTGDATPVMTPGVAVNGVKFEPATAETVTCDSGEMFRVEALQDVYDLGLDFNNAHVQPTGEYHYHGISELLATAYENNDDLVHVGFAADGFLIYYSKSGGYASGFVLSTAPRSGTDCVGSMALGGDDVEVDDTSPDGTYASDYVWSDAAGDLDACNGAEIDGTYAYVITNEYPFVGRCLNGEVADGAAGPGGPPPGEEGATSAGDTPDLAEAAASLGVTEETLTSALGGPPPDLDAAAETLGVSVDELTAALPAPPAG